MRKAYDKKHCVAVWARYYGVTKSEAREALNRAIANGTDIQETIKLMEDYFVDEAREAAYWD